MDLTQAMDLELVPPELERGPWRSKNLLPSIKFLLYFQVLRGNTTASSQEAFSLTMSPSGWPSGSKIKWLECLREDFKWEKSWCPRDPWWTNWMCYQYLIYFCIVYFQIKYIYKRRQWITSQQILEKSEENTFSNCVRPYVRLCFSFSFLKINGQRLSLVCQVKKA